MTEAVDPIPWRRTVLTRPFVCFRILLAAEPTDRDFTSTKALGGRREPHTEEGRRIWTGISVYDSEDTARGRAEYWWPRIGTFIARMDIVSESVLIKQTTDDVAHCTVWGVPEELRASVSSVVPVRIGAVD